MILVSGIIPARHVLCIMLFTGFMTAFLLRVNLSLAIVAMVKSNSTNTTNSTNQTVSLRCFEKIIIIDNPVVGCMILKSNSAVV